MTIEDSEHGCISIVAQIQNGYVCIFHGLPPSLKTGTFRYNDTIMRGCLYWIMNLGVGPSAQKEEDGDDE